MPIKKFPGLNAKEAEKRLKKYGLNDVKETKESILKIFINQVDSPLIYLLLIAGLISFFIGDISDTIVIGIIIFINTFLGFFQEYKSNKTFENLEKFITSNVTVIRDGKELIIDKKFLVPGDIVIHKLGDIISADFYVLYESDLIVDESSLTGESQGVYKKTIENDKTKIYHDDYIVYSGSTIARGSFIGKVFATGEKSKFGRIANLSLNTKKKSEYEDNLANLSKWFTFIAVISLAFILGAHILFDQNTQFIELLLFTMAIAVTIIPEALPVVSTLALTQGALKLSKHQVIVKNLAAIHDLGNIDIICTDKTGTLTQNNLEIVHYSAENKQDLFYYTTLISHKSSDPFDLSIYKYSLSQLDDKNHLNNLDEYKDIPFDPKLRFSGRSFKDFTIYKGSPENIVTKYCDSKKCKEILDKIEEMSANGFRDLSLAIIDHKDNKNSRYIGTFFFEDKIKDDAFEAIKLGFKQNISFKIITGDSFNVALHVGKQVNLVKDRSEVIEASDLSFDNPEKLFEEVNKYHIFARSDPEQKYNIILALQKKYRVGYLGDGINDAPSLKVANVGMVVEFATDIAKSNADIILLSKNLKSIVNGIIEGRKVFVNIDKYLKHTLSSNFGNLYTIGLISLFLNFLPMLPIQILVNNLLSDIPCLALASDNVEHYEIKKPKHHTLKKLIEFSFFLGIVSSIFDIIFFLWARIFAENYIQSMSFFFATITELVIIFSMRTRKFMFKSSKPSKLLVILALVSGLICLLTAGAGWNILHLIPISFEHVLTLLLIILGYLIVSEICKLLFYKFNKLKEE